MPNRTTRLSFEFFPPREEPALDNLMDKVVPKLSEDKPAFYSVTYGAGGSTRAGTYDTVTRLIREGHDAAPHLSIGADDDATVVELLTRYKDAGVKRIVALRGDVPSGVGRSRNSSNAQALVSLIRREFGDQFEIEVAAYPEIHPDAPTPYDDLDFFKRKVDAGADNAITQYFYNPYAYLDFRERCVAAGINIPIYVGIMPINSVESILRFSAKAGADVPRWMEKKLHEIADDDKAIREFSVEVCTRLVEDLQAQDAPGFHFYTLNRWGSTKRILNNLTLD